MRYYLVKIAYNKVAKAEDRPQPAAFDTIDDAKKAFHAFMSNNIKGSTIGWCMATVINEYGATEIPAERWEDPTLNSENPEQQSE